MLLATGARQALATAHVAAVQRVDERAPTLQTLRLSAIANGGVIGLLFSVQWSVRANHVPLGTPTLVVVRSHEGDISIYIYIYIYIYR
jgi:hypothetical protein